MLQLGAAGSIVAGGVWVAPSVLSIDDACACGSGPQTSFNWAGFANDSSGTPATAGLVTITITTTNPGGQAVAPNNVVQTQAATGNPFGNQSVWWQMRQNAVDPGSTAAQQTATFTFTRTSNGQPVFPNGLCFSLIDIDLQNNTNNGWRDEVWITDENGNAIPFTFVKSSVPNGPTGNGTDASRFVGQTGNIANNSTDGNVLITLTGTHDAFRINYRNNPGAGTNFIGSIMRIGIANLSWRTVT